MTIITAVVMGIIGGLLVKALFAKESNIVWDVAFGLVGGIAAYYLSTSLTAQVSGAVFALGIAVMVAGLLLEVWKRFGGKPA